MGIVVFCIFSFQEFTDEVDIGGGTREIIIDFSQAIDVVLPDVLLD